MSASADSAQFAAQYETSPIILNGGIAAQMAGQSTALASLLPTGFAKFRPVAGASLLKNECATYPMANQAVAGNAMIAMPIPISMEMVCPSTAEGVSYLEKSAVISGLVATLKQHNATGGTYSVYTPAFFFDTGVLTDFRDATPADDLQAQVVFRLDFFFPLLTVAQAQAAAGALYQTIDSGAAINGQPNFSTGATAPQLSAGSPAPPTIS